MRMCSVEGCNGVVIAKNLCHRHYKRVSRTGHLGIKRRENGTGSIGNDEYIKICQNGTMKPLHVMIVEKILGKTLPDKSIVHHADGNRANNDPRNLVVCPDQAYHFLLHRRQRALEVCGHASWFKCYVCKVFD